MRILHAIHSMNPDMGGLPKTAAALPAAQALAGAEVGLLYYASPAEEERIEGEYSRLPGFARVRRMPVHPRGAREGLFSPAAIRAAAAFRPEILHTHGIWEPLLRNLHAWARRARVPYVILPQSMLHPWQNRNRKLAKFILKRLLGWSALWRDAAFWQALTGAEKTHLEEQRVCGRIEVIPNGIFPEEVSEARPANQSPDLLPGLRGRPYVLSLARLHAQKSPDILLEAFALLAGRMPDLTLVMAGPDYGLRALLERRVDALGLRDRVFLPGALDSTRKQEILSGALLFCLPSQAEGFSLALLEAAAAGLPLVISPGCHFDELAAAGAAHVAEVEPRGLAGALAEVAGNPDLAARMGAAARSLVASSYTWPTLAARLLDRYEAALRREGPS